MQNIITEAIIQCLDQENSSVVKDCFQAKPDFNVILQHIHQTGNYRMLEHIFPFLNSLRISRKVTVPVCAHLACCTDEQSQTLLKEFMRCIELYPPQLFFELGKKGIPWDTITIRDGYEKSYFLGVVNGKSLRLFEQFSTVFEPYRDYMKRYAGKNRIVAAANYFGYDPTSLELYAASLLKKLSCFRRCLSKDFRQEYCTKTKELFINLSPTRIDI